MELDQANAELEQKVRDRTAKLQETVAELEHFSYTITHDMRAPLRAMYSLGGVLLEECSECLHPTRQEYIRQIVDSADRMDKLITDALQYSGEVRQHFELEPVDADALLRGILESYPEFQPPQANIHIDTHLPVVLGNKAGLTQCFSNLLGNAVKFVHPGQAPEVRVWAESVQSQQTAEGAVGHATRNTEHELVNPQPATLNPLVRLWFEDKGIGIEEQYHDKIWQMFQQLNKSYEGTGIGLALVRKVVDRMGGKVGVESEPGHGSRFWIELKRANGQPHPTP
jgi:signal transduction histidine kinase